MSQEEKEREREERLLARQARLAAIAEGGDGPGEYVSDTDLAERKSTGPIMMHSLVEAPVLSTGNLASILEFEKLYVKYEREISALCTQDVKATVKTLASCIEPRVLKSICKYELDLGSDGWKTVDEETLRKHLFKRRATLSQRERLEQARLLEQALVMTLKGNNCEGAAIELFEILEEFLGEDEMDEVISVKKQCKLLVAALKPPEVKSGVEALLDDTLWVAAKTDVVKLRKLVLEECRLQDACWERRPPRPLKPAPIQPGAAAGAGKKLNPRDGKKPGGIPKKHRGDQSNERAAPGACFNCKQTGHISRDCPQPTMCGSCGKTGHVRKDCPKTACYNCGKQGHRSRDCTSAPAAGLKRVEGGLSSEVRTRRRNAVVGRKIEVPLCMDNGADNSTISFGIYKRLQGAGVIKSEKGGGGQFRNVADNRKVPLLKEICVQLNLPTLSARNGVTINEVWLDVIGGDGKELLFGKREWRRLGLPLPEDYLDQLDPDICNESSGISGVRRVAVSTEYDSDSSSDEESGTMPLLRSQEVREEADAKGVENLLARAQLEGASASFLEKMSKLVQGDGVGKGCLSDELRPGQPASVEPLDIEFVPGAVMPRMPAMRHYSPLQLEVMREQNEELLKGGLIWPGTGGETACPVLMTKKKPIPVTDENGEERMESRGHRLCVDEKPINNVTVGAPFPMPLIDHVLAQYLEGATHFGTGDALKGYWQFPITKKASRAWAYMTPDGIWEPGRVPMGVKNAVPHYQRIMTKIFREAGLLYKGVLIFIDDILVYAKSEEKLAALWARVFAALAKYNIYLCTKKTHLWKREVVWCGKLISAEGRSVDPRRVEALCQVPEPTDSGQLMGFLACANWIRDHIPGYAPVVAPLQELLRSKVAHLKKRTKRQAENVPLGESWEKTHATAWSKLKQSIVDSVTLTSPNEEMDFCLYTDASDNHWGSILTQVPQGWVESDIPPEDWPHQPLAFLSGSFKDAQLAWPIVGKEAFAVHESCDKLEHFIQRNRGVNIFTDHRNLVYIFDPAGRPAGTSKGTAGRLERWGIALCAVPYTIQHIEGEANGFADMLSRWGATKRPSRVKRVSIPLPDGAEPPQPTAEAAVRVVRVQLRPGATAAEFVESDDEEKDGEGGEPEVVAWPSQEGLHTLQGEAVGEGVSTHTVEGTLLQRGDTGLLQTAAGQVWVPQREREPAEVSAATAMRLRLMVVAHCGMGGHRGSGATARALGATFWWPSLKEDVKAFSGSCLQCCKNAHGHTVPRPLGEAVAATGPNQVMHFDFLYMGKSGGMVYLLVLKDGFSGVVELFPCEAADSESAGRALVQWFSRYGQPPTWVSDQGPHFKNECIDAVRRAFKVNHHFTCPEAAWSNGTVERVNREVLRLFRALLSENRMGKEQWLWLREAVQAIINHTPTERLGQRSPMEVHTGQRSAQPLDCVLIKPAKGKRLAAVSPVKFPAALDDYMRELQLCLDEMHQRVSAQQRSRHEANKRQADGGIEVMVKKRPVAKHGGFDVGDFVLVARDTQDKLAVRWLGPMRVVKVVSDWVYEVEDLVHQHRYVRHSKMLRRYSDQQLHVTERLREQLANDDASYYHVDHFTAWKKTGAEVFLQVRWKGFTASSDTWVNLAELAQDVPDRVRKYCETHSTDRNGQALVLAARAAKLYA